jgi:stage II sporulation protein D
MFLPMFLPRKSRASLFFLLLAAFGLTLLSCSRPLPPVRKEMVVRDAVATPAEGSDQVKIGIRVEVQSALIHSDSPISISLPADPDVKIETWAAGSYLFSNDQGQLKVAGKPVQKHLILSPVDVGKPLKVGERPYRGRFLVRGLSGSQLTVINELSIDDYLKGVLPREVVVTWPMESLKAQAVASRTYLASHMKSHAGQGFSLCSDVHCQVYGGMGQEHPQTNAAVDSTRRQILTMNSKPIGAYFHASCGGMTERISLVWGNADQDYLPRKRCEFCAGYPRLQWNQTFSHTEMLRLLKAKKLVQGNRITSVRVKLKSPSGRAQIVTVVTDKDTYDMRGNAFRLALHPEKIRSTKWTSLKALANGVRFEGTGWGHGVGMCQWGAKGQAEAGRRYQEILAFYYPNSNFDLWQHP